jgi:hypothetical protein
MREKFAAWLGYSTILIQHPHDVSKNVSHITYHLFQFL